MRIAQEKAEVERISKEQEERMAKEKEEFEGRAKKETEERRKADEERRRQEQESLEKKYTADYAEWKKARHLVNFRFKKNARYNLSDKPLRLIENPIQKRSRLLLD